MAITQSRHVADMLTQRTGRRVEIVGVTTLGDVSRDQLTQIGGTGVFVSALREALLGGEVDLAVHSLKDLPGVHSQVDLTAGQGLPQRADEDAGPADLAELIPAHVAQRGHADDLHPAAGPLGDHVGHLA